MAHVAPQDQPRISLDRPTPPFSHQRPQGATQGGLQVHLPIQFRQPHLEGFEPVMGVGHDHHGVEAVAWLGGQGLGAVVPHCPLRGAGRAWVGHGSVAAPWHKRGRAVVRYKR